jgi:uncharacterized protein (DUF2147 family)
MGIKSLFMLVGLLLPVASVFGQAEQLIGTWLTDDQKTAIEFFKSGSTYSGRIAWMAEPNDAKGLPFVDRKNPDESKRNQKVLGLTIITGLAFKKGEFIAGTVYAPKRGIYAKCSIKVLSNTKLSITVSSGLFSDTKTWTKK